MKSVRAIRHAMLAAAAVTLGGSLAACEEETPAEQIGEAVEKGADKVGDSIEDAGDAVKNAAEDAQSQ